MKRFILYFILIIATVASMTLVAQPLLERNAFVMNHLTTADGLDNMRVFSILQGSKGEMWISTRDGINRYNGSTMVNYRLKSDYGISNAAGRIISLMKEKGGKLYAYDNKGNIYTYNEDLGRFDLFYELYKHVDGDIEMNGVYSYNGLRLALRRGVYKIENGNGTLVYNRERANDITGYGSTIFCGLGKGVLIIRGSRQNILPGSENYNVQTVAYDELTHYLWIGTLAHGTKVYDYKNSKWIENGNLDEIPDNPIRSIVPYNEQTMLVGIDGAGVYKVNRKTMQTSLFLNAEDKTGNALTGNGIYTICVDRDKNIWVGSYTGGVDIAYPRSINVDIYRHEYKNSESLVNNTVNDICETPDGTIWFATNIGLSIYKPQTRTWQHTMQNKVILTACPNGNSSIYAGTYGDGVYEVNANGSATEAYSLHKGNFKSNYISSAMKDKDGDLWIGSIDGQLACIHNGQPTYYDIWEVQCLAQTPAGNIAAGYTNGFVLINKHDKRVDKYFTNSEFQGSDVNSFIKSMIFNNDYTGWIGTDGGGVYLYDLRKHKILKNLTTEQRLPSNSIAALIRDRKGNVFVSTDRGLSMINKDHTISNLSMVNGMEQEYNRMACALLKDDRVAFGGNNGAVVIGNTNQTNLNYKAQLNINRVIPAMGEDTLSDKSIKQLHDELKEGEINLSYSQNTFEVGFECINYRFQHDIEYQYQLEGFDNEWLLMPSLRALRYTNLPPGTYTLHVKAVSKTNGRVIDQKDLKIHVSHPWYSSPLAWLIYILFLCSMAWLLWRNYRTRLEKRYYDDKINFFVNTAHDIRTPLSLVLAPLNDLAKDEQLSEKSKGFLAMAQRNGDRLMKMVTQLLDFQKYDTNHMDMNVQQVDLKQFLEEELERFDSLAKQKNLKLSLGQCEDRQVWIDHNIMEVILVNLVSNAIKYTHEGGTIEVSAIEENGQIALKVKDTGIGIPKSDQKGIFSVFYRAANAVSGKETGSGLGLMITRRMAERMDAALTFESEEGKGTTFTLKPIPTAMDKELMTKTAGAKEEEKVKAPEDIEVATPKEEKTDAESKDKLLFVDDNEELRNYMHMAFDNYYDITTAESGEKALEFLQNGGLIDIVVSDVMMPGIQGTELCNRIKENPDTSWLPVILLTAKSGKDFMIGGLNLGADDYVTKPFDPEILRSKIDSMLKNRRRLSKYYLQKALEQARGEQSKNVPASEASPAAPSSLAPQESLEQLEQPAPQESPDQPATLNPADQEFVDKATKLVLDNISDEDFDINTLCREMAMSRTLFYGRLKTLTGQTPQDFIRLLRLEHATALLKQGMTVNEVAMRSGFTNSKYFATVFKKQYGISPSALNK